MNDALHAVLAALDARVEHSELAWLNQQIAVSQAAGSVALRTAIARCARRFDEAPLALEGVDGFALTVLDGARIALVLATLAVREPTEHVALLDTLLRTGDLGEQVSLIRALSLLPEPARFVGLAIDLARTNNVPVFAALANDNPYPARHFPDAALRQLVLKSIFVGVPVGRIVALAPRVDAELLRMVDGYAAERTAAGRVVPEGVLRVHELRTGATMKLFDPHIHMTSRTTDDYQAMADAGIAAIVEPAFWVGQPRTHVGTFEDYFLSLLGWERFRAQQFGIHHFCTIGLNPKEANNPALAPGVLELMPLYLEKQGVVAVGEIGFDDQTDAEMEVFVRQLELAREHELPVLIHTPHRDKLRGTMLTLEALQRHGFPMELALVDHNTEETLPAVLESGAWAGHSIYPETKMDEHRMVALVQRYGAERIIVNSAADWGVSDPLKVPKTAAAMAAAGIDEDTITTICWNNPVRFFAQSGRLALETVQTRSSVDQRALFEGNSVLRGQTPRVEE